jgi:hypothetical protein
MQYWTKYKCLKFRSVFKTIKVTLISAILSSIPGHSFGIHFQNIKISIKVDSYERAYEWNRLNEFTLNESSVDFDVLFNAEVVV